MLISDGTGPTNGLTEIGRAAVWYTTDNGAYNLIVPVVGYANPRIFCSKTRLRWSAGETVRFLYKIAANRSLRARL